MGTELPTLGLTIATALADSINPCVIGVLIFLVAFLNKTFGSPKRMLLGGLYYTAVVYITYLVLGLALLEITFISASFSRWFYIIAAIIAILAGLFEMKDYFFYGKGFTLQIIPGGGERIKYYTNKIAELQRIHPLLGFLFIGFVGVFVVLVELPCTGAPYLAIIAVISETISSGQLLRSGALPLLLIYNLIFVLPLLVIVFLSYFGKSSDKMEVWRKENRGLMRLGIGLFLLALGGFMLYSVI